MGLRKAHQVAVRGAPDEDVVREQYRDVFPTDESDLERALKWCIRGWRLSLDHDALLVLDRGI